MSFLRVAELFRSNPTERLGDFPRIIYTLWIQGEAAAPDLVRFNWDRWSRLNRDYELVILDGPAALRRIGAFPIDPGTLAPQAFSDVLRAKLLADAGGVWTDASVFPVVPLSEWLDRCLAGASFFAYEAPGGDRPISSWFLAARRNSPIMAAWWAAVRAYWSRGRALALDGEGRPVIPDDPAAAVAPAGSAPADTYYYFWFHYLFAHLCATDRSFRHAWGRCSRKSALPPHGLQDLLARHPDASEEQIAAAARSAEVQKLDWKVSYPLDLLSRVS